MIKYPESFKKLIENFEMYPGIGPKTAERLAYFTILNLSKEDAASLSDSIINAIGTIKKCDCCGMLTDDVLCDICSDDTRLNKLMIVENTRDAMAFEKTNIFEGKYHILNGVISPLNGIGPEDIKLQELFSRIEKDKTEEVIIATSSTIEGEMTSMYIKKFLENKMINVYRIGYGLPAGADIEYADEMTLIKALEGKKEI